MTAAQVVNIERADADGLLLNRTPTLRRYLRRIGTVPRSFRRYVIEGKSGGYVTDRGSVTIEADGTVTCKGAAEMPSEAEAAAIKAEVSAAEWPKSMPTGPRNLPEELQGVNRDDIFVCLNQKGDQTLFVQQRINTDEGKTYRPWSYWSDGVWRAIEPDGPLPLFGLQKLEPGLAVFLHEGGSSARHVQRMIKRETSQARETFDAHPWASSLSGAVHIGWLGGAPNPHRTDWSPLRSLPPDTHIYVVADNDPVGVSAVSEISRAVRHRMTAIVFDNNFNKGFDLADPWPQHPAWWNGKRYVGPTLDDLSRPATWATTIIRTKKKGAPKIALRDQFKDEWFMSMNPHLLAHVRLSDKMYSPEVFNRVVAPFSDAEDVVRLLAKELSVHADGIAYRPESQVGFKRIINVNGARLINTFRPATIVPAEGDSKPFIEFMDYLFPDPQDRAHVMRWCATLIARPDIRMQYALLLISTRQGVGKTSLVDAILAPLVGPWNVSSPTEYQVTESGFNSWAAHKRLASINEIYSGHSRKTYDRLKQIITDDTIQVNQKYVAEYTVENHVHVAACSNSIKALHLDDGDRRWLAPQVTEDLKPKIWWVEFHGWLRGGGLAIIAAWAEAYVKKHGPVEKGDRAPETSIKSEIIAASRSEGQQMAFDIAQEIIAERTRKQEVGENPPHVVLLVEELRGWITRERGMSHEDRRMESPLTLRKALVAAGMVEPERNPGSDRRIKVGQRWQAAVATFVIPAGTKWDDIKDKKYLLPLQAGTT